MTAEDSVDGPGREREMAPAAEDSDEFASATAPMPGPRAASALTDRVRRAEAAAGPTGLRASANVGWLIEQYLFCREAGAHVSSVLEHTMSAFERNLWTWATRPETWHVPLYRHIFSRLSISPTEVDALAPAESTCRYLRALRVAAETGPVACSAAMMFVEKPPALLGTPEDRCWADLTSQGPFRPDAILPLWPEHPAAASSPYRTIGEAAIANRDVVDGKDFTAATDSLDQVASAAWAWMRDVTADSARR